MLQSHAAEDRLRADVVRVCRRMHERGYVSGWAGNVSARLGDGRFLVTPSGVPKSDVEPDDLIVIDGRGAVVSAARGLRPTSEVPMHLCAYRRRPDVGAVVHAHPIHAVALSIAGDALAKQYVPEAIVVLGPIAVTPYATPSTDENERVVDDVIAAHDAIVLRYHGSLTVGRDVDEAYLRLETLEHAAQVIAAVESLGGGPEIEASQVAKLVAQRATSIARRTPAAHVAEAPICLRQDAPLVRR